MHVDGWRWLRAACVVALSMALAVPAAQARGKNDTVGAPGTTADLGKLKLGKAHFWTGPVIESSGLASGGSQPTLSLWPAGSERCADEAGAAASPLTVDCLRYVFAVPAGGARLRVSLDHPDGADVFGIELRDPSGETVASDSGEILDNLVARYNADVAVDAPAAGAWELVVVPSRVSASQFRLRALLQRRMRTPQPDEELLPDMRPMPPFEIGFYPGPGVGTTTYPAMPDVFLENGCYRTEVDQFDARRCLRFSQGPANLGPGLLDLIARIGDVGSPGTGANGDTTLVGDQFQRIWRGDGSTRTVPAGRFEYHPRHRHYHHSQVGDYTLWRVVDPKSGRLADAGRGPKGGHCLGDYSLADWRSFDVAPPRGYTHFAPDSEGHLSCFTPVPGGTSITQTVGWADVYTWDVEGNFVDFGENPDGRYLIRVGTNVDGSVHEARYDNNLAYAYIAVCGDNVDVLERGYGLGPWDRNKVLAYDGRRAAKDSPKTYAAAVRHCRGI